MYPDYFSIGISPRCFENPLLVPVKELCFWKIGDTLGKLEFTIKLLPYDGDDGWVEATLAAIRQTLSAAVPPPNTGACE